MPGALSPFAAALADLKEAFATLGVGWYVFGAQAALILAGRDKDLEDVAAILAARGAELNANEIQRTLAMVEDALGQSDLLPMWERLRSGRPKPARKRKPVSREASASGSMRAKSPRTGARKGRTP